MSLFDDASLVYIPTGYKATKNYSGKPSTGGADMTFSRASGATRVNSKGLVEKVRTNLLLQSNTFNTTWTQQNTTLTSGQSGYDGSSDAWKVEATSAATTRLLQSSSIAANTVVTVSLYAKVGNVDFIKFNLAVSGTNSIATFDLTDGTIYNSNAIDTTWKEVGNGWVRISATFINSNVIIEPRIELRSDYTTDVADAGSYVYIQDAQLEYGLVATNYIETTTATVSVGPVNDEPRLTYDPVNPTAPSLLMEPQRTNLVTYSEYFGASNWILDGSAITTNATTSPEGVANATKLEGDGSSVNVRLYDSYAYPSTGDYTFSVYAKAGTNDFVLIAILGVDGGKARYFDLVNGIAGSTDSKIEAIGTDGWYRCSFTATLTGPDTTGNFNIYVPYSIDTNSFPSAGDANGQYVYIYGAQLEQASYESSYIPTNGTSVTRVADLSQKTGASDIIGQTEGTIYWEADFTTMVATGHEDILNIDDGVFGNTIYLIKGALGNVVAEIYVGAVQQASFISSAQPIGTYKMALAYANNNTAFFVNGEQVGATDTSCSIPATSRIQLGNGALGPSTSNTKKVLLFPTRLDNATLATLTSL